MTDIERYHDFFDSMGIEDDTQKEHIIGSLFQLANIILNTYEEQE